VQASWSERCFVDRAFFNFSKNTFYKTENTHYSWCFIISQLRIWKIVWISSSPCRRVVIPLVASLVRNRSHVQLTSNHYQEALPFNALGSCPVSMCLSACLHTFLLPSVLHTYLLPTCITTYLLASVLIYWFVIYLFETHVTMLLKALLDLWKTTTTTTKKNETSEQSKSKMRFFSYVVPYMS